ncbi:MAG: hypothetical protein QXH76_06445 [Nitrososphaerota archaeon]
MVGERAWLPTPEISKPNETHWKFPVAGSYPCERMRGSNGLITINFPVTGKFSVCAISRRLALSRTTAGPQSRKESE